jgi:predicted nucleotidyltransferase
VSFLATIDREASDRGLRYLVIGGLAVNVYGYSRDTSDLDFFVSQNARVEWMNLLEKFEYKNFHDGGNFIQFEAPNKSAWPVDLMLVQERTFAPIFQACVDADIFGVKTRIPSLEHLIVLKLHALKNTRMQRFLKDFLDVENLIRINQLDIKSKEIRELFDKYGTSDLYEKISQSLLKG